MALNIGLDIGGTFTDLIIFDEATGEVKHGKSPTTPSDLTIGILNCLKKVRFDMNLCRNFVHGTTHLLFGHHLSRFLGVGLDSLHTTF